MPPVRWEVRRFASLGSTNDYVMEAARAGAPQALVAVADHQSAGRGRLGRHWEAPPGRCLLASVLLRPLAPATGLFACTAAVALATARACETTAGVRPAIKWPNDLVVGDEKLAGVLAESDPRAPGGRPGSVAVVVGVGCNVEWPLPGAPGPPSATSLLAHSARSCEPQALLSALLDELSPLVGFLDSPRGRAQMIEQLRARCSTLGRRVRVELVPGATATGSQQPPAHVQPPLVGTAISLTNDGCLVVRPDTGPDVTVTAGDVHHLRPQ